MKKLKLVALFCAMALLSISCEEKDLPYGKLAISNRATAEMYIQKINVNVGKQLTSNCDELKSPGDVEYFDLYIDETYNVDVYASSKSGDPESLWICYKSNDKNIQLNEYKQTADIKILTFPDDFTQP